VTRPGWRGDSSVYRILIPEKYLLGDGNPFDHIIQGFERSEDGKIEAFDERMTRFAPRILPAVPHLTQLTGHATQTIPTPAQAIACRVRSGVNKYESKNGNYQTESTGTLWLNDDVPFGIVKAEVDTKYSWGSRSGKMRTTVLLKKIEKNAKSRLFASE